MLSQNNSSSGAPTQAGLRLLFVDDHKSTVETFARLLKRDGHAVTCASSVAEALEAAAQSNFDLLISDISLPDGTGHQLMEELRSKYGLKGIAVGGHNSDEDKERAHASGFIAHLVKPVQLANLRQVLENLRS